MADQTSGISTVQQQCIMPPLASSIAHSIAASTAAKPPPPAPTTATGSSTGNVVKVGFYEVESTIGKGNYAVVKLARHRITKTEVNFVFEKWNFRQRNLLEKFASDSILNIQNQSLTIFIYTITWNVAISIISFDIRRQKFSHPSTQFHVRQVLALYKEYPIWNSHGHPYKLIFTYLFLESAFVICSNNGTLFLTFLIFYKGKYQKVSRYFSFCIP